MPGVRGLLLLALCLNLHRCRAFPNQPSERRSEPPGRVSLADPLLDYVGLDEELGGGVVRNGTGPGRFGGCGPCEKDLCPESRGCRAGLVLDSCGCCMECGNLEGQACDPGERSVYYGLCGTGLRCRADPRPAGHAGGGGGEEEDDEEEVCVCEEQQAVCGTDGVTYLNVCQFREAAFSKPGLKTRGEGPCKTGRTPVCLTSCTPVCLRRWMQPVFLSKYPSPTSYMCTCLSVHMSDCSAVCLTVFPCSVHTRPSSCLDTSTCLPV